MPRTKAVGDKNGGHMEDDNGWCEFIATETYRDNVDTIFGKKCYKCKKTHYSTGEYCKECKEETV